MSSCHLTFNQDSNTIDCVWNGFTANCADDDGVQRADKVDFTYYYMTNAQCILRLDTATDVTDKSQFSGMTVAYEASSAAEGFAAGQYPGEPGSAVLF